MNNTLRTITVVLAVGILAMMTTGCATEADAGPPATARPNMGTRVALHAMETPAPSIPAGQVRVKGVLFVCRDLELAFNTMSMLDYDNQVLHVSNEMNAQTNAAPYISAGDAERALQACDAKPATSAVRTHSNSSRPAFTPRPTHPPTIAPTPNVEATKRAIAAADQRRREADTATRVATEAQQEADRFAAELEATRTTELAIVEATRAAETAMAQAARVAEIQALCQQWEPMVLAWVKDGNYYDPSDPTVPFLPDMSVQMAAENCNTDFPRGRLFHIGGNLVKVGTGADQLLPGTYHYQSPSGNNRVEMFRCKIVLNHWEPNEARIDMVEGKPFEITFHEGHNDVTVLNWNYGGCSGFLHRVSD